MSNSEDAKINSTIRTKLINDWSNEVHKKTYSNPEKKIEKQILKTGGGK